jgi:hypothetical protein
MHTYYRIRSLRPAWLFSRGLLSVPAHTGYQEPAGSPTRRRAHTWRSLFIAPCALRAAPGKGRVLARLGRAGDMADFGLVCLVTAFMDNQS